MTEAEQALIWPELADDVREVAEFNLETPKRINEILPLKWPNVDLPGETIRIRLKGKKKLFDDPIGPSEVMRLQRLKARKLHPIAVFTYVSRPHAGVWRREACQGRPPADDLPAFLREVDRGLRQGWHHRSASALPAPYWRNAVLLVEPRQDCRRLEDAQPRQHLRPRCGIMPSIIPDLVRDLKRAFAKASKKLPAKLPARLLKNR